MLLSFASILQRKIKSSSKVYSKPSSNSLLRTQFISEKVMMKKTLIIFLVIFKHLTVNAKALDIQTVNDLHLSSSKKDSLIDKLGPTQTNAGKLTLEKVLSEPLTSIDTIMSRQEFIRELVDNPELRAHLKKSLATYTLHEAALEHFLLADTQSNFYWPWKWLNSRSALSIYHSLPVEMTTSISHLALTGLVLWHTGQKLSVTNLACGGCHQVHEPAVKTTLAWSLIIGAASYMHLAEHANGIVQSYRNLSRRRNEINKAYIKLRSISQSLHAAKDVFHQVENKTDVLGKQPAQLLELFNMLPRTNILQSEEIPTALGVFQQSIGDYLVSYRHLSRNKKHFPAVAEYIGKVDAYLTIAELVARHRGKENSYTWVDLNSSASVFESKGIWNPMLESELAVSNDISFDIDKNKLLLTGANASGKSVFASAVAINTTLAQSFGVAAAKSLVLKPFKKILTHIHFTDDVNQGLSTMRAELQIVGRILKQAASSDAGPMLIIFDDSLFKGTSTKVGENLAFKTFRQLADHAPEVTVIGVTHYDGLVQAAQSDEVLASTFRLAHMAIKPACEDQWEPKFKLEFGPATYSSPLVLLPKEELVRTFGED